MAIEKLKTKFVTGAFINDVKHFFKKINEIIDWINNIGSTAVPNYKIYKVLVSQTGTGNPTVTVLENTLGTVTWTRSSAGNYYITSNDLFTDGKTFIPGNTNAEDGSSYSYHSIGSGGNIIGWISFAKEDSGQLLMQTISSATNNAVEFSTLLPNSTYPFEIIVYN